MMRIIYYLLIFFCFFSCTKDPSSPGDDKQPKRNLNGVFILNEGNFGKINATLSYYDPQTNQMVNTIFKTTNDRDLGSIAQSIVFIDSIAIVVVNGSDKLEVINARTFKAIRTVDLPAGSSPKNIVVSNNEKAYITNLYTSNCTVLNLKNWQIIKQIAVGANPEGIAMANDRIYVANSGFGSGNTISVISIDIDEVTDTIFVADNPITVKAVQDRIYILCTGSYGSDFNSPDDDTPGALFCIDAKTNTISDSVRVDGHPSKLALNDINTGFFIGLNGIMRFDTETMTVETNVFIEGYYYGLACDPVSQNIYLLDAKDFLQRGQLIVFDYKGTKYAEHTVGIIPGTIGFYYDQQ
jgi:hypothetical protein